LDAAIGLGVAAALRVNHVMAITILAVHQDLHILQQADVLAAQIRGFTGFDAEDRARPFHLLDVKRGEAFFFRLRQGSRGILPLAVCYPQALHIKHPRDGRQGKSQNGGPPRVSGGNASIHIFS
jgi:hypothetical protein